MDLFLKISVLQANFCWLGDLGEIICPWTESVAGKKVNSGCLKGDLMSGIASSSISLAGSEEQINFSQQTPKILKMASESFYSCFFVVFRSFSQNFLLGAPVVVLPSQVFAVNVTLSWLTADGSGKSLKIQCNFKGSYKVQSETT